MTQPEVYSDADLKFMRLALRLASRGYGSTSPNPMVGALLVRRAQVIGQGWHHRAGEPHAEIEALRDAQTHGHSPQRATLYVTLEPCSTHGRTPPCTKAIISAGIRRVVVATTDPNPAHAGRAYMILSAAGIEVAHGVLVERSCRLNEAFNHWIVHKSPFVTVKAAMTLDGRIATARGESKWITGERARAWAMKLRQGADAILVGINTVLADDPSLTIRSVQPSGRRSELQAQPSRARSPDLLRPAVLAKRRIVLDSHARTPITAKLVSDEYARHTTTVVVTESAPQERVRALAERATVWTAPAVNGRIDLRWLLARLGAEEVTHLLVEGGGEINAAFLLAGLAQRVAFFYAPKILGGRDSCPAVAGEGVAQLADMLPLQALEWRRLGSDLLLTARVTVREPQR
jgi:diaminohydroxyphosphoribosylaminopyrimidine deaminase/5-amino-6-(5-phosphoribosylamino)uracil reductase